MSCIVALWLFGAAALDAAESEWPEGYLLAEDSKSPDGHYGVLIPSRDGAADIDSDKIVNAVVDLKSHQRLAVIRGAHYFKGENHCGLKVDWSDDSSWCAVTYDGRYGFQTVTLVELKSGTQTDVGQHIQKELNAAIARHSGGSGNCYGAAWFHSGPGQTMLVRGQGLTNPKQLEDARTDYSLFLGTFDLATHRWTRSASRAIDDPDPFGNAFAKDIDENTTFNSEDDRMQALDTRLNDVYRALRVILPAERFAAIKKEQITWLKRFEATESVSKKRDLLSTRIKELRRYAW